MSPGPPLTFVVDTDLYTATITAKGARLLSFRLKRYKETVDKNSPPYDVIAQGEHLPMGLVVSRGDKIFADQGVDYTTDAPARVEVSPGAEHDDHFHRRYQGRAQADQALHLPRWDLPL